MLRRRVIPSLLLKGNGLVKTIRFAKDTYIGDPINAIRIFNDKEVDELVILDIEATASNRINYELLSRINKEAFMPLAYGGGIKTLDEVKRIITLGYEKVILDSAAIINPKLIEDAAKTCGSQSVVVCIDVKRSIWGQYKVFQHKNKKMLGMEPVSWAKAVEQLGAGEIILYSVDRDGTMSGYDVNLIKQVSAKVTIPVVALGGARNKEDLLAALAAGADAISAGSMFVYYGPHKAVLISYLPSEVIDTL